MSADESWSLDAKLLAYRRQMEAQLQEENEVEKQLERVRKEKRMLYNQKVENAQRKLKESLYITIPLGIFNVFLMKSILVFPLTVLLGSVVIPKVAKKS